MLKASKRNQNSNIYCLYSPSTNKMSSYLFSVAPYLGDIVANFEGMWCGMSVARAGALSQNEIKR